MLLFGTDDYSCHIGKRGGKDIKIKAFATKSLDELIQLIKDSDL